MNCLMSLAKKFALPVFIIFALSMTACQVGLGAAVDSQPPVVDIQLPAANSIIREKFTMSGNWSDDREIAGIKVELENSSTKETLLSVDVPSAQLADNKWFLEINPLMEGVKLPDGKYNATVSIKDKVDHITSSSVAFIIDNTPPLVILSRPATKAGATSPDEYGCDFTLEGEAVDDNLISLVEVEVYDAETNGLRTTVSLSNVSKKIDRSVAVFGADDKAYEQIYGAIEKLENATPKSFYCKVFAYDEARQVPAVEGDKGNRTEVFYLESEVSKYISEYKSSGFYEILKGTYTASSERSAMEYSVDEVKAVIENNKIQQASFSLDPRNNPKYTVSSRNNLSELLKDGKTLNESDAAKFTNNETATVNFLRGLDDYYLNKDTMEVALIECDENGKAVEGASPIVLFPAYKDKDGNVLNALTAEELEERENEIKTSGSTYSVNVKIGTKTTEALAVGKCYLFKVTGYDDKKNGIFNYGGTDYAFKLVSANATPSLTITKLIRLAADETEITSDSKTSTVLGAGEELIVEGEASLEDLIPELQITYGLATVLNPNVLAVTEDSYTKDGENPYGLRYKNEDNKDVIENKFRFKLELPDSEKNTDVKLRVVATNPEETDQQATREIDVSYDCEPPVFDDQVTITPTVTKADGKDYVNGTITIMGSVSDKMNSVTKVYTKDAKGSEGTESVIAKISATGFEVDTTRFTDGEPAVVTIFAVDKAGNIGKKEITLNVDQSTDAPVITWSTADPEIKDIDGIITATKNNVTNNIYQINGSNNYIGGSISDDDGIKSVSIFKRKHGDTSFTETKILENGTSKAYTFKDVVSKFQGDYDVYLVVKDTAGESTGFNMTTSEKFYVGVDEGAPNFMITTAQGLQAQNLDLKIVGTVVDGTDVAIRRYVYKEATSFDAAERYFKYENSSYQEEDSTDWTELPEGKHFVRVADSYQTEEIKILVGETSWSDTIPAEEVGTTGATVYYEATDAYGQTTGQNYMYSIDSFPPVFKVTKVNENIEATVTNSAQKNIFVKNSSFITIEGTVEDQFANDSSKSRGLDSFVYFKLSDTAISPVTGKDYYDITDWSQSKPIDSGVWKQTLDVSELGLSDGTKYTLYVAAKDAAGNISVADNNQSYAVNIIADATNPSFGIPSYTLAGTEHTGKIQIQNSNRTANIKVEVTVTDPSDGIASGIESVVLMENSVDFSSRDYSCTNTGSTYTFTVNAQKLATGSHFLTIRATDKVGNKTDLDLVEIAVDVTPPTLTISGVSPSTSKEGDLSDYFNGKVTVKAVASDETNLSQVDWWIDEIRDHDGNPSVKGTFEYNGTNDTNKNISFVIDTYNKITKTSGIYTLKMQATDAGGNVSDVEEYTLKIDQATDTPVIVFNNIDTTLVDLDKIKNATIAGNTNNIFGSVTDNQVKWNISDDDGIKSLVMKYRVAGSADDYTSATIISNGTSKSYKNNYVLYEAAGEGVAEKNPLFKEAGLYEVIFEVADTLTETKTVGEGAEDKSAATYGPFVIAIDDAEPSISLTTDSDDLKQNSVIYTNKDIKVTLKVSDDYGLDSLTYSESGSRTVSNGAVELPATGTNTKVHTIAKTASSGKIKNVYKVLDTFGKQNTATVEYVFDLDKPVVTITAPALVNGFFDASKSFTVEGTASEPTVAAVKDYQSGLSVVKYSLCKGALAASEYPSDEDDIVKAWTEADGSAANWKVKFDSETVEEGEYTLFVRANDKAGNTSEVQVVSFKADRKNPEVSVTKVNGVAGTDFASYYKDTFTMEGTITETYLDATNTTVKVYKGIEDVSTQTGVCIITKPTADNHTWKVEIKKAENGANDGDYHVEVLAKDLFGKPNSGTKEAPVAWVSKTAKLDTVAPVLITDNTNTNAFTFEGKKVSEITDAWFKSNSLSVKGGYTEAGSGIKEIKYEIAKPNGDKVSGVINCEDKGSYEIFNATVSGFVKSEKDADGTFKHSSIKLTATDNAGNDSSPEEFIVKIDQQGPTVGDVNKIAVVSYTKDSEIISENLTQGATKLVNGSFDVTVVIPVSDDFSTVDSVKLKIGDENFTSDAISTKYVDETKTATVKIEKEKLSSNPVYIQATDKAGNDTTQLMFRFNVDDTAPNVGFSSNTTGSTVNKTITLRGTVEDDQKLSYAYLEYKTSEDEVWTMAGDTRGDTPTLTLSGSVWSKEIDTKTLTDGATYTFRLTGVDTAANISSDTVITDIKDNVIHTPSIDLKIDQDSDRPVIELQNVSGVTGTINQSKDVQVLVSDDDGLTGLRLWMATGASVPSASSSNWKEVELNNGSGKYTLPLAGTYKVYFKVKDAKGEIFTTRVKENPSADEKLLLPKLQFQGSSTKVDNNKAVEYTYDAVAPELKALAFGFASTETAATAAATSGEGDNFEAVTTSNLIGGNNKKYVVLSATVKEDVAIDSVSVSGYSSIVFDKTTNLSSVAGTYRFISNVIDASTIPVAELKLTVNVKDKSGRSATGENSITFKVDNGMPSMELLSPVNPVSDTPEISGTWKNDGAAEVDQTSFKYVILNDKYYNDNGTVNKALVESVLSETAEVPTGATPVLTAATTGSTSWKFTLNNSGDTASLPSTKDKLETSWTKVEHNGDNYKLIIYCSLKNTVGTVSYIPLTFTYNPFGNRPSSSVSYPTGLSGAPASLNGSVRISGTGAKGVSAEKNIKKVYLQFDLDCDGDFADDMLIFNGTTKEGEGAEAKAYDVSTIYAESYKTASDVIADLNSSKAEGAADITSLNDEALGGKTFWGIATNDSNPASWFLAVNVSSEFQNAVTSIGGNEYKVGVRSIAVSEDGVFGTPSDEQYFKLDTNIPRIGEKEESVVEYDDDGIRTATRKHVADMFTKGVSSLRVSVEDAVAVGEGGINQVMYFLSSTKEGLYDAKCEKASITLSGCDKITKADEKTYGYYVNVPLSQKSGTGYTRASGELWIKVVAYKENAQSQYAIYNVNFDNIAPTIDDFKLNSVSYEYSDKKIVNSNGKFTVAGSLTDTGAGFERAAFYYVRGDGTTYNKRLYDPMKNNDAVILKDKTSGVPAAIKTRTLAKQVLYGTEQEVKIETSKTGVSTITLASEDDHIKAGGLACIDGAYLRISEKAEDEKTLTLSTTSAVNGTDITVFFPYVQVVDNTNTEKTDSTGLGFDGTEDGDGMPESIIKNQFSWTWDATLQSRNIPDGPGTMVVFLWDKAGNISAASYECSVQNNAPRLVKLHLGTDFNKNGEYSDKEFVTYDVLGTDGRQLTYDMSTFRYNDKSFRIKNNLAVVAEFTGGNNVWAAGVKDEQIHGTSQTPSTYTGTQAEDGIMMVYNSDASSETEKCNKNGATGLATITTKPVFETKATLMSKVGVTSDMDDSTNTKFYKNNIWAFVIPNASLGDESSATAVNSGRGDRSMSFTFWDKTEDSTQGINSSYMHLRITDLIVDVVDTEAPDMTINPFYWNSITDSSVPTDKNGVPQGHIDTEEDLGSEKPAVSGQVYIEGRAWDGTMLGKLYMIDPDGTEKQVAEYDSVSGKWIVAHKEGDSLVYEYNDGSSVTGTYSWTWPSHWQSFEIMNTPEISQDGHEVTYRFAIDMTKYGIAKDKTVQCKASDKAATVNTSEPETSKQTTKAEQTSLYKMDFVPYVKGIKGVTRSRLGRYPVAAGSTVTIEVMNCKKEDSFSVAFYKSSGSSMGTENASDSQTGTATADGEITITVPDYSCWADITVAGVRTKNNINANDKANIMAGNYKTGDLKKGENYWTDDVYLSVWNVGYSMPESYNPISGTIEQFPVAGTLFEAGNSSNTKFLEVNRAWGAWSANDVMVHESIVKNGADRLRGICHSSNNVFAKSPADLDVCMIGNVPFYVLLDNGLEGSGTWKAGLMVVRNGHNYQSYMNNADNYSAERLGNGNSDTPNSSDGKDEMMFQFKNPKITGYEGTDEYYLYISYYDAYAKCLKFAKYRFDKTFNQNCGDIHPIVRTGDNNYTNGKCVIDGWDVVTSQSTVTTTWDVGLYSDIKVDTSTGIPYVVYYDGGNKCLKMAKGKNAAPTTGRVYTGTKETDGTYTYKTTTSDDSDDGWSRVELKAPAGSINFGTYVSMEMDGEKGFHITAQDADNGNLYYAYLDSFDNASNIKWHLVDATSTVGAWTDIKLQNSGNSGFAARPVISYEDTAKLNTTAAIKIAFIEASDSNTITWECMTDPAKYAGKDQKTSIVVNPVELDSTTAKARYAVGFNSSVFAVDFLRDEE
ncbi:MAG: Ig-like domain-containing protein [Treponema sp.]|nr:Ig-like domain-containing protein [Treponema sp.]